MLKKVLERADLAVNRLNSVLTSFERELKKLKKDFTDEITDFKNQADSESAIFEKNSNRIIGDCKDKLDRLDDESLEFIQRRLEEHRKNIQDLIRKMLIETFEDYRKKAKAEAEKNFEVGVKEIMKKYSDKLAPVIIKSILKYFITFGRSAAVKKIKA